MTVPIWVPIVLAVLALGGPLLIFVQQRRATTGEVGTSAAADVWKAAESQLTSYQVELRENRQELKEAREEGKQTRVELQASRDEGMLTRAKLAEVVGGMTLLRGELQTVSDKLTVSNALVAELQEERRRTNG